MSLILTLEMIRSANGFLRHRTPRTLKPWISIIPNRRRLQNSVTRDEIIETITHLAFYSGWPPAMTALTIARKAFDETNG
jgi:hypothetical protein